MTATTPHQLTDDRLRDLVDLATLTTARARRARLDASMRRARQIGFTLHAARDVLDAIGSDYIDAARAYITAGEKLLAELTEALDRAELTSTHAERVTAHDVLAWIEQHEIAMPGLLTREIERRIR